MTFAAKKLSGYTLAAILCFVLSCVALAQGTVPNDAFFVLCARGTVQEVGKALASGADIGARDVQGMTVLMHAAKNPDHRVVTLLLAAGAKPNVRNLQGETALMMVVENNSPEVVKFLLDAGVDVNAKNQDGVTALMRAARSANPEVVAMLLAAGAKVNARDREKRTALMWAANGKSSPETVKMLLNAGAHVNARSGNDATALLYAAQNSNVDMAQVLLDSGAKANLADENGMTPLMVAAKSHLMEMARLLLKSGANVNIGDKNGATALIWAAVSNSSPEMVKALLEAGADVNTKTTAGATALMWAAHDCEFEVVKVLLDAKADVQASDNADHNALWYARNRKDANGKIVGILEKLERPVMRISKYIVLFVLVACLAALMLVVLARIEPVRQFFERLSNKPLIRKCSAFVHRCIERVKTSFMREPASVGDQDPSGKSSSDETFLTLCQKGTTEEVQQPPEADADENNALIKAVRDAPVVPAIAALVRDGADVNCKDDRGRTPLMWAVTNGSLEVVKMLLGAGAKVDEREDQLGRTALMLAVDVEDAGPEIVGALLEAGANVNARDRYECTAEKYARNRDKVNWRIVQMLEERRERSSSEIIRQIVQDELVLQTSQANAGNKNRGGSDYIGRITDEFNGPLLSFGEKFWSHVRDRSQKARELLTDASIKIVSVEYVDRFLCSPLACSLLCMIIVGLRDSVGLEKFNNVHIDISTQANHNSRNTARYIWENWQNGKVMDSVLAGILESFGIHIIVNETENHDRWLYVGFSSGEKLGVSLGSGVSYWKMNRISEGYHFDFAAQPSEQIERLKNIIKNPQNYIMGKNQEGTNFNIKIQ